MLTRLRILLQLTRSSEFMRLFKEYYTLQSRVFRSIPEHLTHKVVLNTNNGIILCLFMSLPREYQCLIQIWAVTPSSIAEKAHQMILEINRQHNQVNGEHFQAFRVFQDKCKHCGSISHVEEKYWTENPQLAPDWYKEKQKEQADGNEKDAKWAPKLQIKLTMITARGDDFEEDGTHMLC